jgi:hypothetical protein
VLTNVSYGPTDNNPYQFCGFGQVPQTSFSLFLVGEWSKFNKSKVILKTVNNGQKALSLAIMATHEIRWKIT